MTKMQVKCSLSLSFRFTHCEIEVQRLTLNLTFLCFLVNIIVNLSTMGVLSLHTTSLEKEVIDNQDEAIRQCLSQVTYVFQTSFTQYSNCIGYIIYLGPSEDFSLERLMRPVPGPGLSPIHLSSRQSGKKELRFYILTFNNTL